MLNLIPMPAKIKTSGGKVFLAAFENLNLPDRTSPALLELAVLLADELETTVGKRIRFTRSAVAGPSIRLVKNGADEKSESYQLTVAQAEIRITAKSETGLFYGLQTLRQLIRTEGTELPVMKIDDAPDYPARRSRVGELIEKLKHAE